MSIVLADYRLQAPSLAQLRAMPRYLGIKAPIIANNLATADFDDIAQREGIRSRPMRFMIVNVTWPFSGVVRSYTAPFTQQILGARFNVKARGVSVTSFTVALSKPETPAALQSALGGDTSILEKTVYDPLPTEVVSDSPGFQSFRGVWGAMGFYLNVGESINLVISVAATVAANVPGSKLSGSALLYFKPTGRQQS